MTLLTLQRRRPPTSEENFAGRREARFTSLQNFQYTFRGVLCDSANFASFSVSPCTISRIATNIKGCWGLRYSYTIVLPMGNEGIPMKQTAELD
jgi:hypothetical protein